MTAISSDGKREYDSWDDLVNTEGDGYAVVVILRGPKPKTGATSPIFARVQGTYRTNDEARRKSASVRAKFKRLINRHLENNFEAPELVGVHVEPIWHKL